jgi:3-hydroxyethyl bacteriochlorophyllide a dehydrogenase
VVWETQPRAPAAPGLPGDHPDEDTRRDYRASTTSAATHRILDTLISRLAPGGEIVLAGFYAEPLSFSVPAGLHARGAIRAAAEWKRPDLLAVKDTGENPGVLSLDGLITHHQAAS